MTKEIETKQVSKYAIISFILGIISSLMILSRLMIASYPDFGLFSFLLSPLPALGAILFGGIGLWKIFKNPSLKGKWLGIVGIILGSFTLFIASRIIVKTIAISSTGF